MMLSKNPTFIKHKILIEEALSNIAEPSRSSGNYLFDQMLMSAEELDSILDAKNGERPTPMMLTVRRDEFHKHCRNLGDWLKENAPDLNLEWN